MNPAPQQYAVQLQAAAKRDLQNILDYIERTDGPIRASAALLRIDSEIRRLSSFPERGSVPRELVRFKHHGVRHISWKPYRVFYRITGQRVAVLGIVDGRRDMTAWLASRLGISR